MLAFPQLITGACAMYPLTKHTAYRTVVNLLDDGRQDVYSDANGDQSLWELTAQGMTRAEWDAIETLFSQVSGRLGTFTFLDPVGNLVAFSQDLTQAIWAKDASVALTANISDPLGGANATRLTNGSAVSAGIGQVVNVPQGYRYCWSTWLRSASAGAATLSLQAGATVLAKPITVTSNWQRVLLSGVPLVGSGAGVMAAIKLPAGAAIEVYGLQLEGQLGPSDYKTTGALSGVFSKARFATDQLTSTAQSSDVFDATIRIIANTAF